MRGGGVSVSHLLPESDDLPGLLLGDKGVLTQCHDVVVAMVTVWPNNIRCQFVAVRSAEALISAWLAALQHTIEQVKRIILFSSSIPT